MHGAEKIILTLGGTASNDGGAGMLCALGAHFFDEKNNSFLPTAATLQNIGRADILPALQQMNSLDLEILSDVESPLLGPQGATYVYSEQKGASVSDLPFLESGMKNFHRP